MAVFTQLIEFFRTLRCAGCKRRIMFWEARYFVEDVQDVFHGECACIFLEAEKTRIRRNRGVVMKLAPADQRRFEAEIVELIRTGKMPTLEQVQAAIETTRQEFLPLILSERNCP